MFVCVCVCVRVCRATDTHDYMYSTPTRLYIVLDATLQAYNEMQVGWQC